MSVSIRQIRPVFVGEVSGLDITRALAPEEVGAIEAGMDRRVRRFDQRQPRDMRRTTVAGDAPTTAQAPAA